MYVRNHMLRRDKLTTVSLEESIHSALEKIIQGNFLSLPVVVDNQLKGIIMKEAIYRHYFDADFNDKNFFLDNIKVKDVYNEVFETINDGDRIESASYLLKKIGTPFLAVLNFQGEFVGILTHSSIFNAFSEIFGIDIGNRIVINMLDVPGQLARLTDILRKEEVNIATLTVVDAKVFDIVRVVLRVDTKDLDGLLAKITNAGFKVVEAS